MRIPPTLQFRHSYGTTLRQPIRRIIVDNDVIAELSAPCYSTRHHNLHLSLSNLHLASTSSYITLYQPSDLSRHRSYHLTLGRVCAGGCSNDFLNMRSDRCSGNSRKPSGYRECRAERRATFRGLLRFGKPTLLRLFNVKFGGRERTTRFQTYPVP